ncbi:hypothetical protein [Hahella ganghwensis]|uniref:hypothetical protein n=1 Tax=Hahella ganghwensis TaxID=286420 RepID=UPI00037B1E38|nr:hypothetical protein [Hahella ganghwensis]
MNGSLQLDRKLSPLKNSPKTDYIHAAYGVINTLERIANICEDSFPLFASAQDGQWKLSSGGSWMGGFWSGCWWLRARLSGQLSDRYAASSIIERLTPKLYSDTIFRSMIYWYAVAPGIRFFEDSQSIEIAKQAAQALAPSYNSQWQCYPMGSALGGGEAGKNTLNIDAFAALIQILQYGSPKVQDTARGHADSVIQYMTNFYGDFYTNVILGESHIEVKGPAGNWARGHSWGLLGLCSTACLWGKSYQELAETRCQQWLKKYADRFPRNRVYGDRNRLDPSASLIAALAMYKLSSCPNTRLDWRKKADSIVRRLIESEYFKVDKQSHEARFTGCCFRINAKEEILGETIWGYFFLLQALLTAANLIDPDDI